MIADVSPGLILILGAVLVPVLRGHLRSVWILALPLMGLAHLVSLPIGEFDRVEMMGVTLTTLRVDELSLAFGGMFLVAIFLGLIYGLHRSDGVEQVSGLVFAGSAVGAVFAGDLVTLFIFWQMAAVSSAFLVWARRSERSYRAGMRYVLIQVASGLLLMEGLFMHFHEVHSFDFGPIGLDSVGGWLLLAGFGISAALPLLHAWLPDSYTHATPTGTVILSAITTKLAVYALLRAFPGAEILVPIGSVMVFFALFYAAISVDLRRVLSYVLIAEIGVMVIGIGIGTGTATAGVVTHAAANIIYMSLLFMAVGAASERLGTDKDVSFGAIRQSMPWTTGFLVFGALSIALPLLAGFTGRALIVQAAAAEAQSWTAIILSFATVGAFILGGLKLVAALAGRSAGGAPAGEAPGAMLIAMGMAAALSLAIGLAPLFPEALALLGAEHEVFTYGGVVAQLQLIAFGALAFVLLSSRGFLLRGREGTPLDFDWTYRHAGRKAAVAVYRKAAQARAIVLGHTQRRLSRMMDYLYRHHGPEGVFGGNWTTGAMAFWTTALLAIWLIAYYV